MNNFEKRVLRPYIVTLILVIVANLIIDLLIEGESDCSEKAGSFSWYVVNVVEILVSIVNLTFGFYVARKLK